MKGLFTPFLLYLFFSITRRFEQALLEGEARFEDENIYVFEMIRQFFDIETLTDRIRTCLHQDKKYLWNEMKSLGILLRKRPCLFI